MELINEQIRLQSQIQNAGYNIVTCGNCDTVNIHVLGETNIICWACESSASLSDCPDYFYEGMPEQ